MAAAVIACGVATSAALITDDPPGQLPRVAITDRPDALGQLVELLPAQAVEVAVGVVRRHDDGAA